MARSAMSNFFMDWGSDSTIARSPRFANGALLQLNGSASRWTSSSKSAWSSGCDERNPSRRDRTLATGGRLHVRDGVAHDTRGAPAVRRSDRSAVVGHLRKGRRADFDGPRRRTRRQTRTRRHDAVRGQHCRCSQRGPFSVKFSNRRAHRTARRSQDVMTRSRLALATAALGLIAVSPRAQDNSQFRFRSGVELINVTATVSDADGRFVPNLTRDDFIVYEDDRRVDVTHFVAERVPVSLGIALDTSGSMAGEKMDAARAAIRRFVNDLLDRNDELFLYRFSNYPVLVQGWTRDRRDLLEPLDRLNANGATAMYDAVARAVPLAQQAQNRKKALVIISDGNDTSSRTEIRDLKAQIRQSEVLVYAVGIDADNGEQPPR